MLFGCVGAARLRFPGRSSFNPPSPPHHSAIQVLDQTSLTPSSHDIAFVFERRETGLIEDVAVEDQVNSNAQSSPCSFLPGRAGAGLENLVQLACPGFPRQL